MKKNKKVKIAGPDDIALYYENELRRLSEKQPVIIFFDDLQWCDVSSLNLLYSIARGLRAKPFPMLMIGTYRPHEIAAGRNKLNEKGEYVVIRHPLEDTLNELRNYTKREMHITRTDQWLVEIPVLAFESNEISHLINENFPLNCFPDDFEKNLANITQGNPLFVSEFLKLLHESGDIFLDKDSKWQLKAKVLNNLPVSVNGVITKRIDLLNPDLLNILECASVNGEKFSLQVISKMLDLNKITLSKQLAELSRRHGLVVSETATDPEKILLNIYSFTQRLIHYYVYEHLDTNQRRIYHGEVADILKVIYGEELEKQIAVKTEYNRHLQIAKGLLDALTMKLTDVEVSDNEMKEVVLESARAELDAANQSSGQYAMDECLQHIEKALGLLNKIKTTDEKILEIWFDVVWQKYDAEKWLGHYDSALNSAKEMLTIADNLNDNDKRTIVYRKIGIALYCEGKYNEAIVYHRKSLEINEALNDRAEMSVSYNNIGIALYDKGNFDESIVYQRKSLEIQEALKDRAGMSASYNNIGSALYSKRYYDEAIEYHRQSLEIDEALNDRVGMAANYNDIGLVLKSKDNYDEAIEYHRKSLEIYEALKNRVGMATSYNNIGTALKSKGNYDDEAIEYHRKSLEIDEALNDRVGMAKSYNNIGSALYSKRYYDEAIEYHRKSLEIKEALNNRVGMSESYNNIGLALNSKGNYDEAIEYHRKSLEIKEELNDKVEMAKSYINIGLALQSKGNYDEAIEYYRKSLEINEALNDRVGMAMSYMNIGNALKSKGNYDEAIKYYRKSLEIKEELNDRVGMARSYNNIGFALDSKGNYAEAIEYYRKSLEIVEELNNRMEMARSYNNIGNALNSKGNYDEAIEYHRKAQEIEEELND